MDFFTYSLFPYSYIALFGAILLLGLIGGELAKRIKFFPTITGYIFVGFLVGPGALNIINESLLSETRIFIDISIGLILFQLGRQLDFAWLRADPSLILMSFTESILSFVFVMFMMRILGMTWMSSAIAGSIAMMTSPAVVMMVAHDLFSQGPVTRRTMLLTSLNNLFGLTAFIILLPLLVTVSSKIGSLSHYYIHKFVFSCILGLVMFFLTKYIAILVGKRKETQFVLFVGMTLLTVGVAQIANFSMMLSLFTFGIATRNFDKHYSLIEIDFEFLARISFIFLFVITGFQLHLKGLIVATTSVIGFIVARTLAKTVGISLFAKASRLTAKQTVAISLALTPMAGITLGLSNKLSDYNQDLSMQLTTIIASVVAILNIVGPIATQYAFVSTNEGITKDIDEEVVK